MDDELTQLEALLMCADTRGSRDRLEALLDDAFVEVGSSGKIWTREAVIEALAREQSTDRAMSDVEVREIAPHVSLVTYTAWQHVAGATPTGSRRSSLWVRQGKDWRLVFHQGTPIP